MYILNQSGRTVDVPENMELEMSYRNDVKVLSVSHNFWRNYPGQVATLKKKNARLVTDEQLNAVPKAEKREDLPMRRIEGKVRIKIPEGKIHFVIYPNYLPKVGGIETAVYELAKLLDRDKYFVTIAYNRCESVDAMVKYSKVAKLVKLDDRRLECDVCLLASNHLQPPQIKAKAWLQWVHSDYEKYNNLQLVDNRNIFKYVAVSKHVARVCKRMFGIECEVIYNLLDPNFGEGVEKPIRLVTNSRLSPEKGFDLNEGKSRVVKFAELLKASGRNFTWTICGDNTHMPNEQIRIIESLKHIENVNFVGYKSDILPTLIGADMLVQLSNFEGCPYSILEALQVGVPCIVTDWKGVEELIEDGVNGYIIRQDMKGVDINKMLDNIPKGFDTKPKSEISQWDKLIRKSLCSKK
jgi:glycosyltransferase involved in cell wall biosynthesis